MVLVVEGIGVSHRGKRGDATPPSWEGMTRYHFKHNYVISIIIIIQSSCLVDVCQRAIVTLTRVCSEKCSFPQLAGRQSVC